MQLAANKKSSNRSINLCSKQKETFTFVTPALKGCKQQPQRVVGKYLTRSGDEDDMRVYPQLLIDTKDFLRVRYNNDHL